MLALEAFGGDMAAAEKPRVFVANAGAELRGKVFEVCRALRDAGIVTEADYQGRSLKGQFKQADKIGARLIVILGGDELAEGKVKVRNMQTHDEELVPVDDLAARVRELL